MLSTGFGKLSIYFVQTMQVYTLYRLYISNELRHQSDFEDLMHHWTYQDSVVCFDSKCNICLFDIATFQGGNSPMQRNPTDCGIFVCFVSCS